MHGASRRQDLPHLFNRFQSDVVVHSGKGLAYVKGLAMTIEIAVIIGSEGGLGAQFACQQAAGEWYTGEDSHLFLLGPREEYFRGALSEAVEDDLYGLNIGELDRLERFFHFLDTYSVVTDFACLDQIVEDREDFRAFVECGGWTVKLKKVESVGRKVAQAVFNPSRQVLAAVPGNRLARQATAGFGRNDNFLLPAFLELCDETLTPATAVDIGGVEKIDTGVDGFVQSCQRIFVGDLAPCAADCPGAKTDVCNLPTGPTEWAVVHC